MARKRNPRRVALEQLREMKRRIDRLVSAWNIASTVYEAHVEVKRCDPKHYRHLPIGPDGLVGVELHQGKWRKREASEYPENQSVEWAVMCHSLDALVADASRLRDMAYEQWATLKAAKEAV